VIDVAPLFNLGLLLVRPGTLLLAAPAFGGTYAPGPVKVGLTVILAITLASSATIPSDYSSMGLVGVLMREFAIGLALALAIRALVAVAELAGQLAGFQMGISYGALIDPQSGVRNNLVSVLYANIAVVTFLATNAHHAFLRALRDTYDTLPIGAGHVSESLPQHVMAMLAVVFSFGLRLAAPLVVVLVITELALALIARSAPNLNLMAIGAPVRLIVGLILLGLVAPAAVGLLANLSGVVLRAGIGLAGTFR
jgi:flagellar biosynthetic protein FliR